MAFIPILTTKDPELNRVQSNILSGLQPYLVGGLLDGQILKGVSLVSGSNSIAHGLNRTLIGWFIVRQRASATLYDTQDSNPTPTKTLDLTASAAVTVDIYVF